MPKPMRRSASLAISLFLVSGAALAQPPWQNGEDIPDTPAAIGAKINMLRPVAVIVITKDGTEQWLFCKEHPNNCRTAPPSEPIPPEWEQKDAGGDWSWIKFGPKAGTDPCVIFRSTNGDEIKKCWD